MPRAWPPSRTSARRSSRDDSPPPEPDCAGKAGARNASLHERDACFVALGQHLVGLGVDAHPLFGGGAGQRAAHLGRRAHRQHAVGHLGARRDERAAGHHRPDADAGAVQHGGSVADEALLAEPGRVHGAVVADRGAGADLDALGAVDVHDRAVLHVGAPVDDDRLEIRAHHRVVPDRGALLDRDVADDDRRRRDERRRMHARMLSLEAEQWHGCGPRSMLVVFSSYVRRALRRSRWIFLDWRRWRPPRPVSAWAVVALQQAWNHLRAFPLHRAIVVAVEICSAAYFLDDRLESAVAHAIFADGAGAVALAGDGAGPAILEHRTLFRPEHLDAMGFEYPGGRPRIVLSKDVRRIGAQMMGEMTRELLGAQGLKREDVRHWILHSAGRRVLDRARVLLELDESALAHSRGVLQDYGNMSSATILFVLERTLQRESPVPGEWGLLVGLGPGFAAEGALLRW